MKVIHFKNIRDFIFMICDRNPRLLVKKNYSFLAFILISPMITSCTLEYMGIPLRSDATASATRELAVLARAGDKQAQLQLGIAFEEGRGVKRDLSRARKLYRLAAADGGGTMWIYVPSGVEGHRGQTMPVRSSPRQRGIEEARLRLEALDEK